MLHERDRRSCAPPPSQAPEPGRTGRKRWERPDVARPAPLARVPLPSADPIVPDLDPPEPLTRLDHVALLPQAARQDLRAATLGGTFMGAL